MSSPTFPLDALREAALVFEGSGLVTAANAAAVRLFGDGLLGLSPREIAERTSLGFVGGTPAGALEASVRGALQGVEHQPLEVEVIAANGSAVSVRITTSPFGGDDTAVRALSIWADETGRRRSLNVRETPAGFLDQMSDAVITTDMDLRVTAWNRAAEEFYGRTAEETLGHFVGEIGGSSLNTGDHLAFLADLGRNGALSPRIIHYHRDHGSTQVDGRVAPLRDEAGDVVGYIAVSWEVAGKDELRADLAESEEKYRNLVELSPDAILIHQDGAIVFANQAAADLVGYTAPGELVGLPILEIVHPSGREHVEWNISADLRGEESPLTTVELAHRDGMTVTGQGRGAMIPFGRRPAIQVVLRDVTEEKRAQEALRTSLERLTFAQRAARSAFWNFVSPPDGLLTWTPEFNDLFGLDPSVESSLELWVERIHPDDREAAMARVVASIRERTSLANEYRILLSDGDERWIGAYGDTTFDADGMPLRTAGICVDITNRKQAEELVRESEERLRLAQSCAGIGVWEWYPGDTAGGWAEGRLRMYDNPFPDILEEDDWRTIVHPDDLERWEGALDAAVTLGEPLELEYRYAATSGEYRWLRILGDGVFDTGGRLERVLGVFMDITDQKEAEAAFRESGQRHAFLVALGDALRELSDSAEIMVRATEMLGQHLGVGSTVYLEVDAAGNVGTVRAGWNDGTAPSATGSFNLDDLGVGELLRHRRPFLERDVPGPGRRDVAAIYRRFGIRGLMAVPVSRGGRLAAVLAVYTGTPRTWTDTEVELARETADRVWNAVARARAEEALRKRERTLQGIFRAAPVGIGMVSHRTITQANEQFARMTGYRPDELIGQNMRLLYPNDETYAYVGREKYAQIVADGIGAVETQWRTKDGAILDILLSSSPVDLSRPLEDVVLNVLDITRLRESERALASYMRDLRRSNEELQRFAYVASHDLQEPLRSIISFSQLLERRYRGKLDADADEFIGFIVEGGNRMQRLIEDLLQLSRVETKAKPLAPTDAGEVVADALRLMETPIREAGARVEVGEMPTVMADAAQLAQVFTNLVGNALKYRRPGVPPEVRISADRTGPFWEFSVADNGIGIEAEYFDRIFVIFQRLHTRDEYEGTGIGLAVVRKIVERHGGGVGLESTPGQGSTFSFTVPAVQSQ